jgi:hypothetical protein
VRRAATEELSQAPRHRRVGGPLGGGTWAPKSKRRSYVRDRRFDASRGLSRTLSWAAVSGRNARARSGLLVRFNEGGICHS